jgi:glycosyltransferase involved in cell wall biosynthesis
MNKPAHIGLNAHLLSLSRSYRGAGISWYIINLLRNLAGVSPDTLRYSAFLSDKNFHDPSLALHVSRLPTQRPVIRIFWEQFVQPLALRQKKVDLLHALAFVAPVVSPCPYVVTVYDLSFLRYPDAFKPFNRWYLSRGTARSVKQAKAVIAISESTRQDVVNLLGVSPERVHTVYCGANANFHPLPQAEVEAFRLARQLPATFVLYLGTLEPRKNVDGLIRAYALWRERQPHAPPLVVAGGKGWYYDQIFALVESLNLTEAVRFPGYIPQSELTLWYNAATLFVYPSHFEGFGLPVLEAMACGTPVITSTESSLPEITGPEGIARLVNPTDDEALATAMAQVTADTGLRASMAERGIRRAAEFTWEKTARETAAIYQQVLGL